jgi:molecular chaperone DnaK (HSP70)
MPAGKAIVRVEFTMDVNGILHISAFEKNFEISKSITMETNSELSTDEMLQILQTAEANRQKDREESALVTDKIEVERLMSFWESIIHDLDVNEQLIAKKIIEELKIAMKDNNHGKILSHRRQIEGIFDQHLEEIIERRLTETIINAN